MLAALDGVGEALSLADLEAFDRYAPERSGRGARRFCCPLPACTGKKMDASHRSVSVDLATGAWKCHRCGAKGKLKEWWTERPAHQWGQWSNRPFRELRRATALPPPPDPTPADLSWRAPLHGLTNIFWMASESYLEGRGIPSEVAHQAGARHADSWFGRPAVVFPVRDREGRLVAACGRYIDGQENPKARTAGPLRCGVFQTPGALDGKVVVITEAPLDALSLAACGLPAVALVGVSWPGWLPLACAFKRVLLATDADEAGDTAAEKLAAALRSTGARLERLRPGGGGKDWNELLQRHGTAVLQRAFHATP